MLFNKDNNNNNNKFVITKTFAILPVINRLCLLSVCMLYGFWNFLKCNFLAIFCKKSDLFDCLLESVLRCLCKTDIYVI